MKQIQEPLALTRPEALILRALSSHGALSIRHANHLTGHRITWQPLVEKGLLRICNHSNGQAIALTPAAGHLLDWDGTSPAILRSPSAIGDQAMFAEGAWKLEQKGYTVHRTIYRKVGYGAHATSGGTTGSNRPTRVIDRLILEVPASLRADLNFTYPQRVETLNKADAGHRLYQTDPLLGRPYLLVARGQTPGAVATVRKYLKTNQHLPNTWGHPVIIAVPDPELYRRLLRADELEAERAQASMRKNRPQDAEWELQLWDRRTIRLLHIPAEASARPRLVL